MTKNEISGPPSEKRSLAVGVPPTGGWKETFLQYAGIPRVRLASIKEGLEQGIRLFLWNREDPFFDQRQSEKVVVITENGFLRKLLNLNRLEDRSAYFTVDEGPFSERSFYVHAPCETLPGLANGQGACRNPEGRRIEHSGITLHERNQVLFISLPWNLLDLEMGARWEFRPFYSPFAGKHFAETGPSIDFGALRRLFLALILHGFGHLGLPLVRLQYPFSGRPAFCFRVDADGFSRESTDSVLRISKAIRGAPFTWFIDVQGWGRNIRHVRDLIENGQEVELHCYHHMTYKRENVNRVNLKMGIRGLGRHGIRPRGVGSPYGFWFKGYQEAVRKLGFTYSSEFAFNCDDVPSFPYNDSQYPLQVPVHVGSIGVFEKIRFSLEEMFVHLQGTIEKAIQDCGCALLCDHPLGRVERYEDEFIALVQDLVNKGYRCIPVSEYAEQARQFLLHEFQAFLVDRSVFIEPPCLGSPRFEIFPPEGKAIQEGNRFDAVFRDALDQPRDEFVCPPGPEFERFLTEHDKDQRLTNLTLFQWYRGLVRHHLSRARRELKGFLRGARAG